MTAFIKAILVHALVALDSLAVFSLLFAALFLAAAGARAAFGRAGGKNGGWLCVLITTAALSAQQSSIGNALVFALNDAFTQVNLFFLSRWGATPLVVYRTVHVTVLLWLAGFGGGLVLLAARYLRLRRELARLPEHSGDEALVAACAAAGLRCRVRVKAAGALRQAGSWGIARPWILVPDDFAERFTFEERQWIYLHELTHFKRRDAARYLALALWKACFWFNPVCRRAAADIRHGFELACDRAVVGKYGAPPLEYSRLLVKTAALERGMPLGFASGFGDIGLRIGRLLGGREKGSFRSAVLGVLFAAAGAGAFVWYFAVAPETKEFHFARAVVFSGNGRNGCGERKWLIENSGYYGAFGQYASAATVQDIVGSERRAGVFL